MYGYDNRNTFLERGVHEYKNVSGGMVYLVCLINQSIRINPKYDRTIGMSYCIYS